jgi:hypothetical protein
MARVGTAGRILALLGVLAALGGAARPAAAQDRNPYPIYTPDQFESTMKAVGLNFAGASALVAKSDFEAAKAQFVRMREQLATTITFWRDRRKDDAVTMLRSTVAKLDEVDAALSRESIEPSAVTALVKEVGAGCQACHGKYREQDPATKAYRVKADALR